MLALLAVRIKSRSVPCSLSLTLGDRRSRCSCLPCGRKSRTPFFGPSIVHTQEQAKRAAMSATTSHGSGPLAVPKRPFGTTTGSRSASPPVETIQDIIEMVKGRDNLTDHDRAAVKNIPAWMLHVITKEEEVAAPPSVSPPASTPAAAGGRPQPDKKPKKARLAKRKRTG